MSKARIETFTCPGCGKELEFTVWDSINTSMDFAVRDVISGDLFKLVCDECGFSTSVDYPMLFHDMGNHVMISYGGPDTDEEEDEFISSREVRIAKGLGYRYRVVSSQEELREKVAIFNSGIDDRVIEVMKYLGMDGWSENTGEEYFTGVYFTPEGEDFRFVMHSGEDVFYTNLLMRTYKKLGAAMQEDLPKADDEVRVDQSWAEKFLLSLQDK